jgi:hypothetical protein
MRPGGEKRILYFLEVAAAVCVLKTISSFAMFQYNSAK